MAYLRKMSHKFIFLVLTIIFPINLSHARITGNIIRCKGDPDGICVKAGSCPRSRQPIKVNPFACDFGAECCYPLRPTTSSPCKDRSGGICVPENTCPLQFKAKHNSRACDTGKECCYPTNDGDDGVDEDVEEIRECRGDPAGLCVKQGACPRNRRAVNLGPLACDLGTECCYPPNYPKIPQSCNDAMGGICVPAHTCLNHLKVESDPDACGIGMECCFPNDGGECRGDPRGTCVRDGMCPVGRKANVGSYACDFGTECCYLGDDLPMARPCKDGSGGVCVPALTCPIQLKAVYNPKACSHAEECCYPTIATDYYDSVGDDIDEIVECRGDPRGICVKDGICPRHRIAFNLSPDACDSGSVCCYPETDLDGRNEDLLCKDGAACVPLGHCPLELVAPFSENACGLGTECCYQETDNLKPASCQDGSGGICVPVGTCPFQFKTIFNLQACGAGTECCYPTNPNATEPRECRGDPTASCVNVGSCPPKRKAYELGPYACDFGTECCYKDNGTDPDPEPVDQDKPCKTIEDAICVEKASCPSYQKTPDNPDECDGEMECCYRNANTTSEPPECKDNSGGICVAPGLCPADQISTKIDESACDAGLVCCYPKKTVKPRPRSCKGTLGGVGVCVALGSCVDILKPDVNADDSCNEGFECCLEGLDDLPTCSIGADKEAPPGYCITPESCPEPAKLPPGNEDCGDKWQCCDLKKITDMKECKGNNGGICVKEGACPADKKPAKPNPYACNPGMECCYPRNTTGLELPVCRGGGFRQVDGVCVMDGTCPDIQKPNYPDDVCEEGLDCCYQSYNDHPGCLTLDGDYAGGICVYPGSCPKNAQSGFEQFACPGKFECCNIWNITHDAHIVCKGHKDGICVEDGKCDAEKRVFDQDACDAGKVCCLEKNVNQPCRNAKPGVCVRQGDCPNQEPSEFQTFDCDYGFECCNA